MQDRALRDWASGGLLAGAALCVGVTASGGERPPPPGFVVHQPAEVVTFDHLCSEVGHGAWASRQAYGLFAQVGGEARALALGEVVVGWVDAFERQGIGVRLSVLRIEGLADWAGDRFAIALQAGKPEARAIGPWRSEFERSSARARTLETAPFALSPDGGFFWQEFAEPGSTHEDEKGVFRHTPVLTLGLAELPDTAEHPLTLVLRNERSGELLPLAGPTVTALSDWLDIPKPEMRTLGLLQTLNPFQAGSVWDALRTGAKYQSCIHARRAAKRLFDARFEAVTVAEESR